jgi:hypothetical protein
VAVEIDGKPHFVVLPHERLLMLMQLAQGLSDDGKLTVVKAPDDYRFIEIEKGKP